MGILTGREIERQVAAGRIVIDPFDPARVGPNSVDLTLGDRLTLYDTYRGGGELDSRADNATHGLRMPAHGHLFLPGLLYLASTVERAGSDWYVPMLEGRSSLARLGVSVHASAGVGDIGFAAPWTLEITVVHPVRLYPGQRVAQVVFHEAAGEIDRLYRGKYANQAGPVASRMWEEK